MQKTIIERLNGDIMYFGNISDSELIQYHNQVFNEFKITLNDALVSNMFKVETMINNSIYKVYPLFYCNEIVSTNLSDKIIENKCIICTKQDATVLTFKSEKEKQKVDDVVLGYFDQWYNKVVSNKDFDFCTFYAYNQLNGEALSGALIKCVCGGTNYQETLDENGICQIEFGKYSLVALTSFIVEYEGVEYVIK